MRLIHKLIVSFLAVLMLVGAAAPVRAEAQPPKLRAAILDGQNNHKWRETTPWLKFALENTGRFEVTVITSPPAKERDAWFAFRPKFSDYDVVISNFTDFRTPGAPKEMLEDLVAYVKNGGGFVPVHAATAAMEGVPETMRVMGMGWHHPKHGPRLYIDEQGEVVRVPAGEGQTTGHGKRFSWPVDMRAPEHPICEGLPKSWMHHVDELWHGVRGPAEEVEIIGTAKSPITEKHEPVMWTVRYGKGRTFVTVLGHDGESMKCIGFQTTLARGCEWAATGKVTLPVPERFPDTTTEQINEKIAGIDLPTFDADDDDRPCCGWTFTALESADGETVAQLSKQLKSDDADEVEAAVEGLAEIATPEAIAALAPVFAAGDPDMVDVLLEGAETLVDRGDTAGAARIYAGIRNSAGVPAAMKSAAVLGLMTTDATSAKSVLAELIDEGDGRMLARVAGVLRGDSGEALVDAVLANLERMPTPAQIAMITALAERGTAEAGPALVKLADESESTDVRLAAIRGLGQLESATASAVVVLTPLAGGDDDDLADAAQAALARMNGNDVDKTLAMLCSAPSTAARIGAIRAVAARNPPQAATNVLGSAGDGDPAIRLEVFDALQIVGGPDEFERVLALTLAETDRSAQRKAEKALLAVGMQIEDPAARAKPMAAALAKAAPEQKIMLLTTLGGFGDTQSLALVRATLDDKDQDARTQAVRTLAGWSTLEAAGDLLAVARESGESRERILALRGYMRLATGDEVAKDTRLTMLAEAAKIVDSPALAKLLLSGLSQTPSPESLQIAASMLDDSATQTEAAMTCLNIIEALGGAHPDAAKAVLETMVENVSDAAYADQARVRLGQAINIARQGVATSPDGTPPIGESGPPAAAIDGDVKTFWSEKSEQGAYRFVVTFPESRRLAGVGIRPLQAKGSAPADFVVWIDGEPLKAVRNAQYTDDQFVTTFPATMGKVLELKITRTTGNACGIRELTIYEPTK